jgi:hypothetical protein
MTLRKALGWLFGAVVLGGAIASWNIPIVAQIQPFNYFVPPSQCVSSVSGNSTGTNGQTTAGTSGTPVVQADTSNSSTNTHTYICLINPPVSLVNTAGNNIRLTDVDVFYGVQTSALGTQAFTGSAGTFNSTTVFTLISFPPPGATETASTVAPVRADTGTLAITPVATSFNVSTSTAGAFWSQQFRPATPIAWTTDLQALYFNFTLQAAATSATITNVAGVLVHIRSI